MIAVGQLVRVRKVQPGHLGPPKYPGRTGVVHSENEFGRGSHPGGLWYVDLDPTSRARARRVLLGADCLEPICA